MKLKQEAINEIVHILAEVKNVASLVNKFGIFYNSDSWSATLPSDDNYEDILLWKENDFQQIDVQNIDSFAIGGCVVTGQYEYKDKYINEPKDLAKMKGIIVERYIKDIIAENNPKFFNIEYHDYGLVDNCGWEQYIGIKATIKINAIIHSRTQELIEEIKNEEDDIIELSSTPVYDDNPKNCFIKNSKLVPKKDFPIMIEFFSNLVDPTDEKYTDCFSSNGLNGEYIRDAMDLINTIEKRANKIAMKYADKGVEVTINDFNEGCQYGMAIYVWIPYQ